MVAFPWSAPTGVPAVGDTAFHAPLGGNLLPWDAAGGLRLEAVGIAALNVAPAVRKLAAEASALAVSRGAVDMSDKFTPLTPVEASLAYFAAQRQTRRGWCGRRGHPRRCRRRRVRRCPAGLGADVRS